LLAIPEKSPGASITWSAAANISSDSDVSTLGKLLYAEDWGAAATVNGVPFTLDTSSTGDSKVAILFPSKAGTSQTAVAGTGSPYSGLSTAYKSLNKGLVYGVTGATGATTSGTITLQGLTVGNSYQVQVWINDSRSGASGGANSYPTRVATLTSPGGNSVSLAHYVGGTSTSPSGGLGQYAIGAFVADATTQPIYETDSNTTSGGTGGTQLNAIQVANVVTTGTAVVQYTGTEQEIDGFGASSAWISSWTVQQADLFFSTNPGGVGLSLLRSRIAPDGTTVEASIMQMAQARGATVWSTPWSPPASDKDSGTVNGGNFVSSTNNYQSYAAQLAGYVATMQNTYGINVHAVSIQNEPTDNETTYESCVWTAQQMHDFIPYLASALYSAGVSNTAILMPEDQSWDFTMAETAMSDPTTAGAVGILAAHDYGSNATVAITQFGTPPPVPIWETEHYFGSDDSIQNGLALAQEIHTFLTVANANAYHYWWLDGSGNGSLAGNSTATPAKRLYVMGNYSKFVRPGFYRVNVTNGTAALVSAFKDPASSNYVIVAANPTEFPITQTFNVSSCPTFASLNQWVTSGTLSLASQPAVSVSGGTLTDVLPAYSVVTLTSAPAPTPLIVLNSSDASGSSSWNTIGNWDDTSAPHAGSTYNAAQYILRTPSQSGSYTFPGNSLTLPLLGCLSSEESAGGTITVPNLILAGGMVQNDIGSTTFTLAGSASVTAPSIIYPGNDATRTIHISATLSGTGTLTNGNGGPGTISYTGNNSAYSGMMLVNGGATLQLGAQSNLGGNPVLFNAGQLTLNNGTLQPTASFAISNANSGVTLGAGGGAVNLSSGALLSIATPVTGPGGLTVYGSGTLALTGSNTFTGPITVAGGIFNVNGLSGGGAITIIGATLGGSGVISGATSIYGILQPSAAGFTFSKTLNLEAGGQLAASITSNTSSTLVPVTATVANASNGATVSVALNGTGSTVDFSNSFWGASHTWPVLSAPTLTGTLALGTLSTDTVGRSASWFGSFALQQTATAVNLIWTPAPPWQQWRAVNFGANWNNSAVAGPTVVAASDGTPNLLKYALGLKAMTQYPYGTNIVTNVNSGGYLQVLVKKNPAATDVTLTVQASSDISNSANWSGNNVTIDQNTSTLLQAHDTTPISAAPSAFMRVMVSQP
jgi:glucuronoarabinoxylan endo-1,4-beta-xylanase